MEESKPKLIKEILELTKADPSKYFNSLADHSEIYLKKLLKTIKLL